MPSIRKAEARDRKRRRERHGHGESGRSVRLLQTIIADKTANLEKAARKSRRRRHKE